MLRLVADDSLDTTMKTSVFNILINVAQDKAFVDECIELNASRRIFDFLMQNVKQDMDQTGSQAKVVED